MILSPEVIAILLLDALFVVFGFFAFVLSLYIARHWDRNASSELQYALEKKAVLVSTIIQYIFYLKLPLFLFFIFTSDTISHLITGAMCAAGVINSVTIGLTLLGFKTINLYLFGFWLFLHSIDMRHETLPYTRAKFILFAFAFFVLLVETVLDFYFFNALSVDKIVSCCGTLFSATSSASFAFLFTIDPVILLGIFYGLFALHILFFVLKHPWGFLLVNASFVPVSILALTLFFGTYIYELPTHHCPFCFLQKEYHYVGYIIYITLFNGTFFGICAGILSLLEGSKNDTRFYTYSLWFTLFFVAIVTAYPLIYVYRNGVWL